MKNGIFCILSPQTSRREQELEVWQFLSKFPPVVILWRKPQSQDLLPFQSKDNNIMTLELTAGVSQGRQTTTSHLHISILLEKLPEKHRSFESFLCNAAGCSFITFQAVPLCS